MIQSVDQLAICYRVMVEVCSLFEDYVNARGDRKRSVRSVKTEDVAWGLSNIWVMLWAMERMDLLL